MLQHRRRNLRGATGVRKNWEGVIARAPDFTAEAIDWTAVGSLLGLGLATALAGLFAFNRRDLAGE